MKKRSSKIILAAFLAAAIIIALPACRGAQTDGEQNVTAASLADPEAEITLSEAYTIDLTGYGQENTFRLQFGDSTFVLYLNDSVAANGTYTVTGNEVVLQAEDGKGNAMTNNRLIADGDRLLFEESM